MDFDHEQLATGQKIRVLTVVDTFSRFSPVIDPRFSYRAEDVVATLERTCPATGYPKTIRVDQGSEFVRRDLDLWAYAKGVTLDFSRPRKTDRQRVHRGVQRALPDRVSEHALVPDPCRRPRKVGGLAQLLQRRQAAWRHWQQAPGLPHDFPPAHPAGQRGKSRKTLPSGGPTLGSRSKARKTLLSGGPKIGSGPIQPKTLAPNG